MPFQPLTTAKVPRAELAPSAHVPRVILQFRRECSPVPEFRVQIGVVVARRKLANAWADFSWYPHAVLPGVPPVQAWSPLGPPGTALLFYAGPCSLVLHASETPHYRDNLRSGRPSLWVALHLPADGSCRLLRVTADPYEGEALTEGVDSMVEPVPMPPAIEAEIAAFCSAFHVERPFIKRARDRADPESLARAPLRGVSRGRRR